MSIGIGSRQRASLALLVAGLALIRLMTPASAGAGTLDQSQLTQDTQRYFGAPDGGALAQTFTAGRSGALDQVDVALSKCQPGFGPRLSIYPLAPSGAPDFEPELARAEIADANVPFSPTDDLLAVHFSPPVQVTAGTGYAIVARGDSASTCFGGIPAYKWEAAMNNPYPRGQAWTFPPEGGGLEWVSAADIDFAFRTYVASARCGGEWATDVGTSGRDTLVGTPRRDVIAGLGGRDTIRGLGGRDLLCGNSGNDTLNGGRGRDKCIGGPGDDTASKCEVERSI